MSPETYLFLQVVSPVATVIIVFVGFLAMRHRLDLRISELIRDWQPCKDATAERGPI
jgi:hypothetical protein